MSTLVSVDINDGLNLKGYLAVDSTVSGRSYGGLRMVTDLSPAILVEAARLMTLKHGFLGLPLGGAKAAIVANPEVPPEEKRQLLKAFGQALMPFLQARSYVPGGDLGVTDDDIRFMLTSNGLDIQPRSQTGRSGLYTGLTVSTSAIRAAQHIGLDLSRASVAIEGFGSVGSMVAQAFEGKGLKVVAISTSHGAIYAQEGLDIGKLIDLSHQVGSRVVKVYPGADQIPKEALLELEVDLLCPCAGPHSITGDNAGRVAARIISPGANAPITAEVEEMLFNRGILAVPDFVANCGGVLGVTMEVAGLSENFIRRFIDQRFALMITEVIETAERRGIMPGNYAREIAVAKFQRVKEAAERKNITNGAFNVALKLYRKGIIPGYLVRPHATRYFKKRLDTRWQK